MRHIVLALLIALCSCKNNSTPRAVVPPTVAEAETFAKDLATKFAPCDADALDRVADLDLMIARAVAGRSGDIDLEGFKRGLKRGMGGFGGMMCKQLAGADLTFTYLRTRQEGGVPKPLLRLITDGGVNYYQLELDKRDGKIKLADLYIFYTGENISGTLGMMIDAIGKAGLSSAAKLKEIRQLMEQRSWAEAQAMIEALPPQLRTTKSMRLAEVQIASELGDEVYLKALNTYAREFPNDPSLPLVAIDRSILRKDYDMALKYISELDARVGGDPYLDVIRAGTLSMAGKPDESLAAAKRATAAEPTLETAWWQLLTSQAETKRYAEAIATIETLRDKFEATFTADTLAADERFVELAKSPEFTAWASKN